MLEGIDPESRIDEDEAMFACRYSEFERKDRRARNTGMEGGRQRATATKRVSSTYHLERAKREKELELARMKKEAREAQSEEL